MIGEVYLDKIEGYVREGWGGRMLASYATSVVDKMLIGLLPSDEKETSFAVFATGSYGRDELCPYSDVDILLFSESLKNSANATGFLYKLWDKGLQISHSFRTPKDCLREAFSDVQIRTSMLEARFVCGNADLRSIYNEEVIQTLRGRKKNQYISAKLREINERRQRHGNSPFMLQPNVKESRGGLRDVHSAIWLSSVLFKFDRFQNLKELLYKEDYKKFLKAYDFLIKLRFVIHMLSRRKNDRLLFEIQEDAAEMLGIKRSKKFTAVERMMRYYFMKSGAVSTFSDRIFSICGEKLTLKRGGFRVKKYNDDFWISKKRIIVKRDNLFKKRPEKMMEAFDIYARTGFEFSDHLTDKIKRNIIYIDDKVRKSRKMIELFFSVLRSERISKSLRIMHETGVLGKFIPEFGSLRYLLVNNYYHEYPVDEHSLTCVDRLESIDRTRDESIRYLSEIYRRIRRKDLLYLSLLLHDIGKVKGRYHESEGYKDIKKVSDRLDLDVKSREFIEQLVKNHILMSNMAFKHDIESPDVIAYFAEKVMTEEVLDAIYLITYADMASVSSNYWTEWRASILHELYVRTKDYLNGIRVEREEYIRNIYDSCENVDGVSDFIEVMPEHYFISSPIGKIRNESVLYKNAVNDGFAMYIEDQNDGTSEVTLSVRDRRGIFSDIVSVFAVRKLNIIEARLFTTNDGFVIDRIRISNWKDLWWEGMNELIEADLRNTILNGKKHVFKDSYIKKRGIESFIEADNERGRDYTVVEVMAPDREGFLYEVTKILSKKGVNIISGKIYTEQEIANDVFYVNMDGNKLNSDLIYQIVGELWENIRFRKNI
ncbi:MAG: [protein-PII] uridylyltransferase [Thermodesulfovibrionales bacterium]